MTTTQKYIVLDNKLLPDKVGLLFLEEKTGKSAMSVESEFSSSELFTGAGIKNLLKDAESKKIKHNFSKGFIIDMTAKLIEINDLDNAKIRAIIFKAEKPALFIDFNRIS